MVYSYTVDDNKEEHKKVNTSCRTQKTTQKSLCKVSAQNKTVVTVSQDKGQISSK